MERVGGGVDAAAVAGEEGGRSRGRRGWVCRCERRREARPSRRDSRDRPLRRAGSSRRSSEGGSRPLASHVLAIFHFPKPHKLVVATSPFKRGETARAQGRKGTPRDRHLDASVRRTCDPSLRPLRPCGFSTLKSLVVATHPHIGLLRHGVVKMPDCIRHHLGGPLSLPMCMDSISSATRATTTSRSPVSKMLPSESTA